MDKAHELNISYDLRKFYARFSLIRLAILVFLLLLGMSEVLGLTDRGMRFEPFHDLQYILFFVVGFSFSIAFLAMSSRYFASLAFYRVQLAIDLALASWWVLLTGVTFSGFVFLYVLSLFFYGRIVGFKTIMVGSGCSLLTVFLMSCIQYYYPQFWNSVHVRGSDIAYNFSLLVCAVALVGILVKVSRNEEGRLVRQVRDQASALRQAESLRFKVFDWLDAGLLIVDQDGRITSINEKASEWLHNIDRNLIYGHYLELYFPEFMPFWRERENLSLGRNMVVSSERNRVFGFKMTVLPENQGWMILFSDITDVHRMETEMKEMEKLATVGELAAGLAHEMKNPLAGIKASLQLLGDGDMNEHLARRLSQVIVRDIDRLDLLLKDFLVFARPKASELERLSLREQIEEILMPLRLQYPEVTIQIDVLDEPYYFDRIQLHQILLNLLVNALQALEETEKPEIRITDVCNDGRRIVTISDNGRGPDPTMEGRYFDPFVTSKAKGSGLGLAIARRLAAQNYTFIDLVAGPTGGASAVLVQETSLFSASNQQEST